MPERLLTQEEMINIMTDVQIIEADINFQKNQMREAEEAPKDFRGMTQSYYDQLFEHYGVTDSIFSQNMRYYTGHPDQLEIIMDSVTQRLLRKQAEVKINE